MSADYDLAVVEHIIDLLEEDGQLLALIEVIPNFTVSQISPLRGWWHRFLATRASRQALGEGDG
jgi:hypothetical protein